MVRRSFVLALIVAALCVGTDTRADDLYSLILDGKLQEAKDSMSLYSNASSRDGRLLFCGALLEPNGAASARMLEASLRASVPARYRQEIYLRLCQYYLISNNSARLGELVTEYLAQWEGGRYEGEMLRMSALLNRQDGDNQTALRQIDRHLTRNSEDDDKQWGEIDKAVTLKQMGDQSAATSLLRKLSQQKSSNGVALALYLLGVNAVEKGRIDDAVFHYNLMREGYPSAVGTDRLVDRLGGVTLQSDGQAEKLTGTFYSVQVGVFTDKGNANEQAKIFKGYDREVQVTKKTVSGREYNVVYVGRFSTFEEARQFKVKLESTHGAVYQVVAR